jgi:hypothetical protein
MVIDSAPIRRKARQDYEKVLRDLDDAKLELERFQSEDRPKYQQWLSARFGARLTELRELEHRLMELEGLVNEVQQEFFFGDYTSIYHAFERVKRRRAQSVDEEFEAEDNQERSESWDPLDELDDAFRKVVEEMFEQQEAAAGEARENKRRSPSRPESAARQNRRLRIKDLYRALVRRLHPDHAANLTPTHIDWWHQTQHAYENDNLEQLELILTLTEIETGGAKHATISILKRITLQFRQTLRSLKADLKKFRQDPAWNFSLLKDHDGLFERTSEQMEREKTRVLWMTEKYEKQILGWEQSSRRPRKRVRARGNGWQEELF